MKLILFILAFIGTVIFAGILFQFIWNDALVHLFDFREISLMHSIELSIGIRLLFQTFEFETQE